MVKLITFAEYQRGYLIHLRVQEVREHFSTGKSKPYMIVSPFIVDFKKN